MSFYIYEKKTDSFTDSSILRVLMANPYVSKTQPYTYHELTQKLRTDFPEVNSVTHILYPGYLTIINRTNLDTVVFKEKGALYCDEYFFQILGHSLIKGDPNKCLSNPKSMVLTAEKATKFFGSLDVIGKSLEISKQVYTVTGIIEDTPYNSHLKLSILLSYSTLPPPKNPLDYGGFTYVKLNTGASSIDFESKLNINKSSLLSFVPVQWPDKPFKTEKITESYYYQDYEEHLYEIFRFREKKILAMVGMVSITIFLVALFNFAIYFFSKTLTNSKQLVVRSLFGASQSSILVSFIIETLIILLLGLLLSLSLSVFLLPTFNEWIASSVSSQFIFRYEVITAIITIIFLSAILFGSLFYFLFYKLSGSIAPSGQQLKIVSKTPILKGLMFAQLTLSLTLTIIFLMINNQINSIRNYSLGYDIENLIEIDLSSLPSNSNPQEIKFRYLQNPEVLSASICVGGVMTGRWTRSITFEGNESEVGFYQVDSDFIQTLGLRLLKGNDFKAYFSNDSSFSIINESFSRFFKIDNLDSLRHDLALPGKIVGEIKDFHYASLKNKITPTFLEYAPFTTLGNYGAKLILRTKPFNAETISSLSATWAEIPTSYPMEYNILKESYLNLYKDKFNQSKLLSASILGILIVTCFGLIGFSSFTTQQRLKEMAIRKVLGASSGNLYSIWIKTFAIGLIIASVISIPISLYFINQWTSIFVYKQPLYFKSIPLAILALSTMVIFTTSYYIYRAISKSEIEILKCE